MIWRIFVPVAAAFVFLIVNVAVLIVILNLNRREAARPQPAPPPPQPASGERKLNARDILGWEFEYARITASEAMRDRHTMMNFFLLTVGVILSGGLAVLAGGTNLPRITGTGLLWLLCGVGWIYFLKIIRLRQAWHDSARTMNEIKEFYIQRVKRFSPDELGEAFRWRKDTLPPPDKPWTVFFYSALLIAFLDSAAYVAGGALLGLGVYQGIHPVVLGLLLPLGLVLFAFHVWLYFEFLRPGQKGKAAEDLTS